MLKAKEIILYYDGPVTVYCEDDDKKYIAEWIKEDDQYSYYVLYEIKNRAEYNEDDEWRVFADNHPAKMRINHTQIDWKEVLQP